MPARSRTALAPLALALFACDVTPMAPAAPEVAASLSSDLCMNVDVEVEAPLSIWLLNGNVVPGGAPMPVSLGAVDGWLASALTPDVTTHGRAQTVHWVLHHVFVTDAPVPVDPGLGFPIPAIDLSTQPSWFLTDDKAVCAAAGGGPLTCRVNDRMEVVAGAGIFANADGFLHNHGRITITDPATGAGIGDFHVRGRICGAGV